MKNEYDLVVLGGGIFGMHAALYFSSNGYSVLLLESNDELFKKASLINQARVHTGYHYPRSIKTSEIALLHKERFIQDNTDLVNQDITMYYGIDKSDSLTSPSQFERFCERLKIKCVKSTNNIYINQDKLLSLYEVEEPTFDPILLKRKYIHEIDKSSVIVELNTKIVAVNNDGKDWTIEAKNICDKTTKKIKTSNVINATYSNINTISKLFGVKEIDATHEISEVVLANIPKFKGIGLTVMDGPYVSVMPFGKSGMHSLTSVLYTHVDYTTDNQPSFHCQENNTECSSQFLGNCNTCKTRPKSNSNKIIHHVKQYVNGLEIYRVGSLTTVKTKLTASFVDDGRPTDIIYHNSKPNLITIFSGKINSIYEIEDIKLT